MGKELKNCIPPFIYGPLLLLTSMQAGCYNPSSKEISGKPRFEQIFSATTQRSEDEGSFNCMLYLEEISDSTMFGSIVVRVELSNLGPQTITCINYYDIPDKMSMKLPDGTEATRTEYYKDILAPHSYSGDPLNKIGTGLSKSWSIDLRKYFYFPRPGIYTFNVAQECSYWTGTENKTLDISQTVHFQVSK